MSIPQERQVELPWSYRDRVSPTRTYCGRVVYERPRHWFLTSDVERIASRAKPASSPEPDRFERVFRALWDLCAGSAIPFPGTKFSSILDYLKWAIGHSAEVLADPMGYLRSRTIELINSLIAAFELQDYFEVK